MNIRSKKQSEVDLTYILKELFIHRVIIIIFSVTFALGGIFFFINSENYKNPKFKTTVYIKSFPSTQFQLFEKAAKDYEILIDKKENYVNDNSVSNWFNRYDYDFNLNILSTDNLERFVKEKNDINEFKDFLDTNKMTAKQYFENKIVNALEKKKVVSNKYHLIYHSVLDGPKFLNEYINFIKKITLANYKKDLENILNAIIKNLELNLIIANKISLDKPLLLGDTEKFRSQLISEPKEKYYNGTVVLKEQILYYKSLIQQLNSNDFNYDAILDRSSTPVLINNANIKVYSILGLLAGFFSSFVFIYLKKKLKIKF